MLLALLACSENNLVAKDDVEGGTETSVPGTPAIEVGPVALVFPDTRLGLSSTAVLTVRSVGDAPLELDGLSALDGTLTFTTLPEELAPGEQTEVTATWTPAAKVDLATQLTVASNDPDGAVTVPGIGHVIAPQISLSPALSEIGEVAVGESGFAVLTVANLGDADLGLYGATLAGSADFKTTSTLPATLAPGASTTLDVFYTPGEVGLDEATMVVTSDDTLTPAVGATITGEGVDPLTEHTVEIMLTADDAWRGWMDGTEFTAPNQNTWSTEDKVTFNLWTGDHALAIYATDQYSAIAAFNAVVWVDGKVTYVTGSSGWTLAPSNPGAGWTATAYDDSSWGSPAKCSTTSIWGGMTGTFKTYGADWVWWTSSCESLGEVWIRLEFKLD